MERMEAVIFDWAGTAVDFGCFAPVQAFMEAFKSAGILPSLEEVRKPMGLLKREHVKAMLSMPRINGLFEEVHKRPWSEGDVDEIYKKSEKGILDIVHAYALPNPYVLETVSYLRETGIKIGSTTGYTDEMMEIVTAEAEKAGFKPDVWFSPNAVGNMGRPYPFMIFKNLEALKVTSVRNVVKVGDTAADIREGKNAGVFSVGVVEGSSAMGLSKEGLEGISKEEYREAYNRTAMVYREAGADYVIGSMKELPGLIRILEKQD